MFNKKPLSDKKRIFYNMKLAKMYIEDGNYMPAKDRINQILKLIDSLEAGK